MKEYHQAVTPSSVTERYFHAISRIVNFLDVAKARVSQALTKGKEMFQGMRVKSRIDELARLKGFTMEGLAKASGLSLVTIRKARRDGVAGIDTLTLKNLQKIAGALGLRPKDLFDDAG